MQNADCRRVSEIAEKYAADEEKRSEDFGNKIRTLTDEKAEIKEKMNL